MVGGAAFPPFDPTTFIPQLFWLGITFAFLYVMLARVALPRIAAALEERSDRIADDLDTAEQLGKQAAEALEAYESAIAEARSEASRLLADSRAAMKAESDRARAEVEAELSDLVSKAEVRIGEAKANAVESIRGVAIEIAGEVSAKVLGATPDPASVESAVDKALNRAA